MASGDDFYKEYKRKMKEKRRSQRKVAPIVFLAAVLLVGSLAAFVTLWHSPDHSNDEMAQEKTNPNEDIKMMSASSSVEDMIEESNASTTQDGLKEESDNESSVTINTTSSFGDDYASQNNQSISGGSDNTDSENEAAYKALLEQMAANEREKQRIAEEQTATQYDEVCKSISQNLSSDLKSAQSSYVNTVNSISCPSFGGCPAMTQAKNNYESSVNAIRSMYLEQWKSNGCQGDLH